MIDKVTYMQCHGRSDASLPQIITYTLHKKSLFYCQAENFSIQLVATAIGAHYKL